MDKNKIDLFIATNSKYFSQEDIFKIRKLLEGLPDEKYYFLETISFKDPTIALVLSILGGGLGIDRFFIGHIGLGILKLITCGGLGIWTIVDWFLIMKATRKENFQKFMNALNL